MAELLCKLDISSKFLSPPDKRHYIDIYTLLFYNVDMSERGSSEIEPAPFSEGDIAGLVNQLLGDDSWSGGDSYEIKIADSEAQIAYIPVTKR